MDTRRTHKHLAITAAVFLLGTGAAAAADRGSWSGTVASVSGDDVALVGVPVHFRIAGSVTEMASGRSLAPQNLAPGTSVTLRVGDREADGRLRAERVAVEAKSPLTVTGAIGRISDDRLHVEVQGVEIELDHRTAFSGHDGSGRLRSARDLRPGALVSVSLVPTTSGTLRAAQVRSASSPAEAGEDQELRGVVTAVSDAAWTVDGRVFAITDQTLFEGDPGVGDLVEVKFHDDGTGAFVADRIEAEDAADQGEVEFRGIVEAIGDASWTISGSVVGVDAGTQIVGSPVVGSAVEVHATKAADGTLTATRIQLEDGNDANDDHGNGGGNPDANDDHGGQTGSGNDDGSGHDAGDDNGGVTPTSGGSGHHGRGNDDTGIDN